MKLTYFVIDIDHVPYSRWTLPFIRDYCDRCGYDLQILCCPPDPGTPASWFKLLAHRLFKSEMVVCADLDIIPMPWAPPIDQVLDPEKLNLCVDMALTRINKKYNEDFLYNCGLIGLPKKFAGFMESIYDQHHTTERICWEQLFINDAIAAQNIPVNELHERWNFMIRFDPASQDPHYRGVNFKHITHGRTTEKRIEWAQAHHAAYY